MTLALNNTRLGEVIKEDILYHLYILIYLYDFLKVLKLLGKIGALA
jgi:hypothetical protein